MEHQRLVASLVFACSTVPWVSTTYGDNSSFSLTPKLIYLQSKLDELSGGVTSILVRLLETLSNNPSSWKLIESILDDSNHTGIVISSCIRQSVRNSIPWVRQSALKCLVFLATNPRVKSSTTYSSTRLVRDPLCPIWVSSSNCKHIVFFLFLAQQIVQGLRPALNDPCRLVRKAAALCSNLWSSTY